MAAEQTVLQVGPGGQEVATKERHGSYGRPGLLHETRLALAVRQVGELLGQLAGGVQLGLDQVKALEALERLEVLRRVAQLLAEVVGPPVWGRRGHCHLFGNFGFGGQDYVGHLGGDPQRAERGLLDPQGVFQAV